jgi:hypothetical protein
MIALSPKLRKYFRRYRFLIVAEAIKLSPPSTRWGMLEAENGSRKWQSRCSKGSPAIAMPEPAHVGEARQIQLARRVLPAKDHIPVGGR